jgi:hypothetical protein
MGAQAVLRATVSGAGGVGDCQLWGAGRLCSVALAKWRAG